MNGEFSIVVKKGQTLVCSFIGYVAEQAIVNQSRINFVLREDVAQLNEVGRFDRFCFHNKNG